MSPFKTCNKCNKILPLNSEFYYRDKTMKDGFSCRCKSCINEYKKQYCKTDSYKENRKKQPSYIKRCKHKDKRYPEKEKIYAQKQRLKLKETGYYKSEKYKQNRKKIAHIEAMRKLIRRAILDGKYGKRTEQVLGYSFDQFKQRIETNFQDGMSWNNHGQWHVDHKKPVSRFPKGTPAKTINALCNLQPLWAEDNFKKGNKFNLNVKV